MKNVFTPFALLLVCAGAFGCDHRYERKIAAQDMPAAVQQAFNAAYPEAEVRGCREEEKSGKKIYEISFMHAGKKVDATYAAGGQVLEVEETIDPARLPAPAQTEIAANYKDAKIKRAEHVRKGERVRFEVKIDVLENGSSNRYELVFAEDGQLLEKKFERENE